MSMITEQILRVLQEDKRCVFEHELEESICAHIELTVNKTTQIHIKVVLMTNSPRARIPDAQMTATSNGKALLPYDVSNVCAALLSKYKAANMQTITRKRQPKSFTELVFAVPDILNPENFVGYAKKGWGKSTTEQAVKYFANTIGGIYAQYGPNATKSDFETYRDEEVKRIYEAKYQRPCKDGNVISRRREQIYNGVNIRYYQARVVQQFLFDHYPELGWPAEPIPVAAHCVTGSKENIKTISYEQYIKMCTLEKRLCEASVSYAYAALCEVICALRVGESGAPLIGDFEIREGYGRYYVGHQLDDRGGRTNVLKTPASYRYVAFGSFVCDMVQLRKKQLLEQGFSPEEIPQMPFASKQSAPNDFLRKSDVSSFVRKLLTLVGCDDVWLEKEAERMYAAAAATGNRDDVDIGAHELRSTLATFLGNGGVNICTLDAYLGHENKENKSIDYASWESAENISKMIERAIHLGSLCKTCNPAFTPVSVSDDCAFALMGNTAYLFQTTKDLYIDMDVSSLEPGDEILLQLPPTFTSGDLLQRPRPDTVDDKRSRPVLPALPMSEEIERWIQEAYAIDLSDIIVKYGG